MQSPLPELPFAGKRANILLHATGKRRVPMAVQAGTH
jgi:hypothetical protein